jgi:hypothetical protein
VNFVTNLAVAARAWPNFRGRSKEARAMKIRTVMGLGAGAVTLLAAQAAFAQDQGTAAGGTGTATVGASATATPATPAAVTTTVPKQVAAVAKEDSGETDHAKMVGRFAVGYLGVAQLPLSGAALGGGGLTLNRQNVPAPIVGARYWISDLLGIDVGLGMGLTGGSTETVNGAVTVSTDKQSAFGMGFHAGVPLALASGKHFTWMVIPELNFGFASGTIKFTPPPGGVAQPDIDLSGLLFDVGARAGAEVHFGFIGVPELSLQASIGLRFRREQIKAKTNVNNVEVSTSDGTNSMGTTVQDSPWGIFTNTLSAFYYF